MISLQWIFFRAFSWFDSPSNWDFPHAQVLMRNVWAFLKFQNLFATATSSAEFLFHVVFFHFYRRHWQWMKVKKAKGRQNIFLSCEFTFDSNCRFFFFFLFVLKLINSRLSNWLWVLDYQESHQIISRKRRRFGNSQLLTLKIHKLAWNFWN